MSGFGGEAHPPGSSPILEANERAKREVRLRQLAEQIYVRWATDHMRAGGIPSTTTARTTIAYAQAFEEAWEARANERA